MIQGEAKILDIWQLKSEFKYGMLKTSPAL